MISRKTARLRHLGKHPACRSEAGLMKHGADLSAAPNSPQPGSSEWGFQVFEVQWDSTGAGALQEETSALRAARSQLKGEAAGYLREWR